MSKPKIKLKAPRTDGFENAMMNLGGVNDKNSYTKFKLNYNDVLSPFECLNLFHYNDLCQTACSIFPETAMRIGYDINFPGDSDVQDLKKEIQDRADVLKIDEKLLLEDILARATGGSLLFLNVDDGERDLTKPLDLNRVRDLKSITGFQAGYTWAKSYVSDISSPDYGEVEVWGLISPYGVAGKTIYVHASRVVHLGGAPTGPLQKFQNQGHDFSILQAMWEVIKNFQTGWGGANTLLAEADLLVHGVKDFNDMIQDKDQEQAVMNRVRMTNILRAIGKTQVIDKEETLARLAANFTGVDTMLDQLKSRLSAAFHVPLTILFGDNPKAPGLNSTGDASLSIFYANVVKYQTTKLEPALNRIYEVLLAPLGQPAFKIKFANPDPNFQQVQANLRKAVADTDNIYFQMQVLDGLEIRNSRFNGEQWSPETQLDERISEQMEEDALAPASEDLPDVQIPEGNSPDEQGTDLPKITMGHASDLPDVGVPSKSNANKLPEVIIS